MRRKVAVPAIMAFFAFSAGSAQAEPKNGFGLDGGIASHSITGPLGASYQSSGLSLGVDYQFALSDSFSLNPFLMTSGESASGTVTPVSTAGHGILGLQLRYWINNAFIGGHLGSYSEMLSNTTGNITTSTSVSGGGAGLVAGWENPNGGMFVMGQLDSANLKYPAATNKLSGFRLSLGYRWK